MKYSSYYITGATGFLGRAILRELLSRSAVVHAFVMKDDPLIGEIENEAVLHYGDITDYASLESFLSGAGEKSCVIHSAGMVSVATRPGKELWRINVEGTENVVRAAVKAKAGKLVYVSSVHAMAGKPGGREIEALPEAFNPDFVKGGYAKTKAAATNAVLRAADKGLDASIVFPSGIIGPGDEGMGSISSMLLSFLSGKLPFAVRGGYDFVDVRDVAYGIVSAAENGRKGGCYILSGHYATIRDILETIGENTSIRRKVSYIPLALAKIIAPFYELDSIRRKKKLFFTPYSVSVLGSNALFSRKSSARELGYCPRSLAETLLDTVTWLGKKITGTEEKKKRRKHSRF